MIAQEVEKVYPELVRTENGIKSVAYSNLVAPLIEAVKTLTQKIDTLFAKYLDQQADIEALQHNIQTLQERLDIIEAR